MAESIVCHHEQNKMKILFISPMVPWPLNTGIKVREFNIIRELSSKHSLDIVCLLEPEQSNLEDINTKLHRYCDNLFLMRRPNYNFFSRVAFKLINLLGYYGWGQDVSELYYNTGPFVKKVDQLLKNKQYDLVFTNYWYTATKPIINANLPTICDTIDVVYEHRLRLYQLLKGNLLNHWSGERHLYRMYRREVKFLNDHDLAICVTERDAQSLRKMGVVTPIKVFAHLRDRDRLSYEFFDLTPYKVLFFGALHNPMNSDAARFCAEEIFPLIREQIPDAELIIAGSGVTPELKALEKINGVWVIGYAPDLEKLFHSATIALLPLRMGSGIKGRVLEAMESGIPLVGSSIAFEGIPISPGINALVADQTTQFASCVIRLLRDTELRKKISINARKFVEKNYSWENTYGVVHECLEIAKKRFEGVDI